MYLSLSLMSVSDQIQLASEMSFWALLKALFPKFPARASPFKSTFLSDSRIAMFRLRCQKFTHNEFMPEGWFLHTQCQAEAELSQVSQSQVLSLVSAHVSSLGWRVQNAAESQRGVDVSTPFFPSQVCSHVRMRRCLSMDPLRELEGG